MTATFTSGTSASAAMPPKPTIVRGAIWESIGYIGIVLLCMTGGFVANLTRSASSPTLSDAFLGLLDESRLLVIIGTLILFLAYLIARSTLLDRPRVLGFDAIKALVRVAVVIYGILVFFLGLFFWRTGHVWASPIVFFTTLPPFVMLFLTHMLESSSPDRAHQFLPKIFYPAVAICFLSFCLGWIILNPDYKGQSVIYIFSLLLIGVFLINYSKETITATVVSLSLLLVTILICSVVLNEDIGLCLLIGFIWTFAIGVAEVAKRAYQLEHRAIAAPAESKEFYIAGTNWSSILFLNLLVLLPLLVSNTIMFAITLVVWALLFAWHLTHDEKKDSKLAHRCALAAGYLLPLVIIGLMLAGRLPELKGFLAVTRMDPLQTDRLITLLGVFLTLIFVLFPDEYRNLPRDLSSHMSFLSKRGCLLFAGASIAIQAVLVTFIFSVLSAGHQTAMIELQFRVDVTLIILIFELIAILVMLLMVGGRPDREASDGVGGTRGTPSNHQRSGPPEGVTGTNSAMLPLFTRLIWQVGRLPVALIAGAGTGFLMWAGGEQRWLLMILHSGVIVLITMSGFALNDAYDADKDRAAGAASKPVVAGLISAKQANLFALSLIIASALAAFLVRSNSSSQVVFIALLGVALYSPIAQRLPLFKGAITAVLCCTPIAYASQVSNLAIPPWLYIFLALFILGRELLLDVIDLPGDLRAGIRTLAAYLSPRLSRQIGWALMLSSIIALIALTRGWAQLLFVCSLASLVFAAYLSGKNEASGMNWTRLTLLFGVAAAPFAV